MTDNNKKIEVTDEELQNVTGGDLSSFIGAAANAAYLTYMALNKTNILAAIATLPDSEYANEKQHLIAAVNASSLEEAIGEVQSIAVDKVMAFFEANPNVQAAYMELMLEWLSYVDSKNS